MPPKFPNSDSDNEAPMDLPQMERLYAMRVCPAEYGKLFTAALNEDKQALLKAVQGNQVSVDQLLLERAIAMEEVRRSFDPKIKALLDRRSAIVAGTATPTEAEIAAAFEDPNIPTEPVPQPIVQTRDARETLAATRASLINEGTGLPLFWLNALRNHEYLEELITERDEEILASLVDVSAITLAAPRIGFAIRYVFAANDSIKSVSIVNKGPTKPDVETAPSVAAKEFLDTVIGAGAAPLDELLAGVSAPEGGFVLVKTYYHSIDQDGDPYLVAIDGTDIAWNEGKNPTVVMREKKQTRGKGKAKQTRVVQYEEDVPSFFGIFKEVEDEDEEESPFDRDHEIARLIAHAIVPRAGEWFTSRACAPMSPGGDEEDGDEDDEEDDNGEKNKTAAPGGQQQPQECKQQ